MTRDPQNIAVFIDGTWNDPDDEHKTNVFRLYQGAVKDKGQQCLYLAGVGNEKENGLIRQYLGGAFGLGADDKKDEAVAWVLERYEPGDSVFFFCFSRGAAIGRMAAGELPHVTFLGCFDTVGAFGLPIGPGQSVNLFKDMHVGPHVQHALHLVSLDETRPAFVPTLMNEREGIEEFWMPGAHSDVGGGNPHRGLSDIALLEMAGSAEARGLRLSAGFTESLAPHYGGTITYNVDDKLGAEPRIAAIQRGDELTKSPPALLGCVEARLSDGYWPRAWMPV